MLVQPLPRILIVEDEDDVRQAAEAAPAPPFPMCNRGRALSRAQILDHVWSHDLDGEPTIELCRTAETSFQPDDVSAVRQTRRRPSSDPFAFPRSGAEWSSGGAQMWNPRAGRITLNR